MILKFIKYTKVTKNTEITKKIIIFFHFLSWTTSFLNDLLKKLIVISYWILLQQLLNMPWLIVFTWSISLLCFFFFNPTYTRLILLRNVYMYKKCILLYFQLSILSAERGSMATTVYFFIPIKTDNFLQIISIILEEIYRNISFL